MVIEDESENDKSKICLSKRKLIVWSFNPSFTLKSLIEEEKPRCIIVTSGTLTPLESYEQEFDISFPV